MERFDFGIQVEKMNDKNLLYEVVMAFANVDLNPIGIDNMQMGYIFEELIRIGAEQSNEEAGEHFTPREIIRLIVNLLLMEEKDLAKDFIVKTIYDPACGTGGMLSTAEQYILDMNSQAKPNQIETLTEIYGAFKNGLKRTVMIDKMTHVEPWLRNQCQNAKQPAISATAAHTKNSNEYHIIN